MSNSSINRTENAFIARGIDSETASKLRLKNYTLTKLLQSSTNDLRELGLSDEIIRQLRTETRPPIPSSTLNQVLFANRWTCCVCRNAERPIVVHHIDEWATSRDHSPANLAVLCTLHHGEAHTKRALELTLTRERLLDAKQTWENYCKNLDLRLALNKSNFRLSTWFYFNHLRIYEMAKDLKIRFDRLPGHAELRSFGTCNQLGAIIKPHKPDYFMYADADRHALFDYVSEMFFSVIKHTGVLNISDYLDRSLIAPQILIGDIILVQGLHTFSPVKPRIKGADVSEAWRSANGIKISSIINLADATSTSAWCTWLRGQKNVAAIIKVREISRENGEVTIQGTALAIRDQDDDLKKRNYLSRFARAKFNASSNEKINNSENWC
jgi:hypothetical protein